ncbi:uncharacterized protein N7496_003235 [Penicillium cataractarum]|uniref:Uncharacterized protein n=1 Tax=Penicillium cataractarum TaxID=2100454 RepID=A0A9W9SM52_9EURO|nr:uncharacterized protein N7496_003235 [Penicillium cataractarum]KAJ5380807.1 hypothetical protein N7496_003235 [Penicillium cataractarum]
MMKLLHHTDHDEATRNHTSNSPDPDLPANRSAFPIVSAVAKGVNDTGCRVQSLQAVSSIQVMHYAGSERLSRRVVAEPPPPPLCPQTSSGAGANVM